MNVDMTLEQAQTAIEAAIQKATQLNTKMDICVVDAGGNLKCAYGWGLAR